MYKFFRLLWLVGLVALFVVVQLSDYMINSFDISRSALAITESVLVTLIILSALFVVLCELVPYRDEDFYNLNVFMNRPYMKINDVIFSVGMVTSVERGKRKNLITLTASRIQSENPAILTMTHAEIMESLDAITIQDVVRLRILGYCVDGYELPCLKK